MAAGACLLLVTHRLLASAVFADLTVLASGVVAAARNTSTFFADFVVGAVFVTGTVGAFAFVALADFTAFAVLVFLAFVGVVRLALTVRAGFAFLAVAGRFARRLDTLFFLALLTVLAVAGRLALG